MKTIIIIPYFGELPNYFQLWLKSVRQNESFNWLLFLDDITSYDYPDNVKVIYTSFREMKDKISEKFAFKISLNSPYKLCDFRPAYGFIFEEYIEGYDFWGYGDIDLLYGNLSKFITDDILLKYDRILPNGHLSLYRNCKEMNTAYRLKEDGFPVYTEVFSSSKSYCFDEWPGVTSIFKKKGIKQYLIPIMADISWLHYRLRHAKVEQRNYKKQCFVMHNGAVYQIWESKARYSFKEYPYIHLQKRKMYLPALTKDIDYNTVIITPSSFILSNLDNLLDKRALHKYLHFRWNDIYPFMQFYSRLIKIRSKNLQKKMKRQRNEN